MNHLKGAHRAETREPGGMTEQFVVCSELLNFAISGLSPAALASVDSASAAQRFWWEEG